MLSGVPNFRSEGPSRTGTGETADSNLKNKLNQLKPAEEPFRGSEEPSKLKMFS